MKAAPQFEIFREVNAPHNGIEQLMPPPPWRDFTRSGEDLPDDDNRIGKTYRSTAKERELVNTALCLRRPLLITGKPGSGKSSLAYAVAYQLRLGKVLRWSITSRSTLREGLYDYDAIGRLQEANLLRDKDGRATAVPDIGRYLRLGPLGTALLPGDKPRVLLIDEIDKSDIDLPNDLLHVFEQGEYEIPELARVADEYQPVHVRQWHRGDPVVSILHGYVRCREFPFVIFTSNGERSFPPAFMRRCLSLDLTDPDAQQLESIIQSHLSVHEQQRKEMNQLIGEFIDRGRKGSLQATDQLLNAIYLLSRGIDPLERTPTTLLDAILRNLNA